jgi:hypothetical protein
MRSASCPSHIGPSPRANPTVRTRRCFFYPPLPAIGTTPRRLQSSLSPMTHRPGHHRRWDAGTKRDVNDGASRLARRWNPRPARRAVTRIFDRASPMTSVAFDFYSRTNDARRSPIASSYPIIVVEWARGGRRHLVHESERRPTITSGARIVVAFPFLLTSTSSSRESKL